MESRLFFLYFFYSISLFAQNDSSVYSGYSKWVPGFYLEPAYSYRSLQIEKVDESWGNHLNSLNQSTVDSLNSIENGKLSFSIGGSMTYYFTRNIGLSAGIFLSEKGIRSDGYYLTGYGIYDKANMKSISFWHIEMPFMLNASFSNKRGDRMISLYAGPSYAVNTGRHNYYSRKWLYWYNTSSPPYYDTIPVPYTVKPFGLLRAGWKMGLSAEFRISENWFLGIQPVFKIYPKSFYSYADYSELVAEDVEKFNRVYIHDKPWSFGLEIGVKHRKNQQIHKMDTLRNRWRIGISASADYNYRAISVVDNPEIAYCLNGDCWTYGRRDTEIKEKLDSMERPAWGLTGGIHVSYRFSPLVTLRTGFYYSDKGIKSSGFVFLNGIYAMHGIVAGEGFKRYRHSFWEIPVSLQLSTTSGRFEFGAMAGFLFATVNEYHTYQTRVWAVNDPQNGGWIYYNMGDSKGKSFRLGNLIGLGVCYSLNDRFVIAVEPNVKYYYMTFGKQAWWPEPFPGKIKMYSAGINVGISVKL